MNHEIVAIEGRLAKEIYIVTLDDEPMRTPDGETLWFLRRVDAERCIEEHKAFWSRPEPPPPGPRLPSPFVEERESWTMVLYPLCIAAAVALIVLLVVMT